MALLPAPTQNDADVIAMKADSGATSHYIRPQDTSFLQNIQTFNGPKVFQPDKTTLSITHRGLLNLPHQLSLQSKIANILPGLSNSSLLSVGKLCNDDCTAVFTKHNFFLLKNKQIILKGHRNWTDGLWDIPFHPHTQSQSTINTTSHNINYIIQKDQPKFKLASYLHACLFSPFLSTLQKAIQQGNLLTFPNINNINFKNALGPTMATSEGHLDQEYSGIQSTKINQDTEKKICNKKILQRKPSFHCALHPISTTNHI